MNNCSINAGTADACLRPPVIELYFAADGEYERICEYHAAMAVDLFAGVGIDAHIDLSQARRRQVALHRTGEQRRYPKYKPHDNTEYDD